jgi:hypothetical protein
MPAMTDDERKARAKEKRAATSQQNTIRTGLVRTHAGKDLSTAVRVHWKSADFTDWSGAVAAFAEGITITNYCVVRDANGRQGRRGTSTRHKMRFNPDGSVTLIDHPGHVLDVESELMLAALGGEAMVPCVAAAVYFPLSAVLPREVVGSSTMNKQLRALHTAVAWAQVPDHMWTPEFGDSHLRYGITPDMVQAWLDDGWNRDSALPFQQAFATLEVANAWREAGQVSQRAAALAGRGEYPDEEARWARVGFTASRSKKWRGQGQSPEQAWEWEQHKVAPSHVQWLVAADARGDMSLATAKEWSKAGVPTKSLIAWHNVTNGDLRKAQHWASARIQPSDVREFETWNHHHPDNPLTPARVAAYVKVGGPRMPEPLARAIAAGVTPADFAETVGALADDGLPDLMAALRREAVVRANNPNGTDYSFSWFAPDRDPRTNWWMWRDLRNGSSQQVSRFILDWLSDMRFVSARQ